MFDLDARESSLVMRSYETLTCCSWLEQSLSSPRVLELHETEEQHTQQLLTQVNLANMNSLTPCSGNNYLGAAVQRLKH